MGAEAWASLGTWRGTLGLVIPRRWSRRWDAGSGGSLPWPWGSSFSQAPAQAGLSCGYGVTIRETQGRVHGVFLCFCYICMKIYKCLEIKW